MFFFFFFLFLFPFFPPFFSHFSFFSFLDSQEKATAEANQATAETDKSACQAEAATELASRNTVLNACITSFASSKSVYENHVQELADVAAMKKVLDEHLAPLIPEQAWREATGNCLASVIGENYASFDEAKAACSVDASCTGVREPEHQKRTCIADHIAKGWCKLDGSICNTGQGGTTTFKP